MKEPLTVTPKPSTVAEVAAALEAMAGTVRELESADPTARERAAAIIAPLLGKNILGAYTFAAVLPRDARGLRAAVDALTGAPSPAQ